MPAQEFIQIHEGGIRNRRKDPSKFGVYLRWIRRMKPRHPCLVKICGVGEYRFLRRRLEQKSTCQVASQHQILDQAVEFPTFWQRQARYRLATVGPKPRDVGGHTSQTTVTSRIAIKFGVYVLEESEAHRKGIEA